MEAAQLIRTARRRRGLNQAELARRAGTSQPVISAYENGHRDPSTSTLRRILAAADERLELGLGAPPPEVPPPTSPEEAGARLVDLLLLADAVGHRRTGDLDGPRLASR